MKMDVVLPLKLNVPGRTHELDRVLSGLLPSLIRCRYLEKLHRFIVVAPEADFERIKSAVKRFSKFDFHFQSEDSSRVALGFSNEQWLLVPGWFKQQLLKLESVSSSSVDLALVLDADVIALRAMPDNMFVENRVPYLKMGVAQFRSWFEASSRALGFDFASFTATELSSAMGVTPEFLSPQIVRDLIRYLASVAQSGQWGPYLMECQRDYSDTWTEYSLYWLWYLRKCKADVNYYPVPLYRFISEKDQLEMLFSDEKHYFAVLQSTKLSFAECESVFATLNGEV